MELNRRMATAGLLASAFLPRGATGNELVVLKHHEYEIGGGVRLHGGEAPSEDRTPVIFVHGSLSDFEYWYDQLEAFGGQHRAIAYSRRYNWPNHNAPVAGYSAIVDAKDLAALIETLDSGPAHIVGHSYGALTALFLAVSRPELVRSLSLAEPPALSLLDHLPGALTATGRSMREDIRTRMEAPMRAAFARGDREAGVGAFIDYVLGPGAWTKMPVDAKAETMRDAGEWDVMMTTGELFPELPPEAVHRIRAPTVLLSGAKSYPFLALTDAEIARLIPGARRLILPQATHQMWLQAPEACRQATLENQARAA